LLDQQASTFRGCHSLWCAVPLYMEKGCYECDLELDFGTAQAGRRRQSPDLSKRSRQLFDALGQR
jgi:hypothetical protein